MNRLILMLHLLSLIIIGFIAGFLHSDPALAKDCCIEDSRAFGSNEHYVYCPEAEQVCLWYCSGEVVYYAPCEPDCDSETTCDDDMTVFDYSGSCTLQTHACFNLGCEPPNPDNETIPCWFMCGLCLQ
jgi:hypothetical protein